MEGVLGDVPMDSEGFKSFSVGFRRISLNILEMSADMAIGNFLNRRRMSVRGG